MTDAEFIRQYLKTCSVVYLPDEGKGDIGWAIQMPGVGWSTNICYEDRCQESGRLRSEKRLALWQQMTDEELIKAFPVVLQNRAILEKQNGDPA